MRTTALLALACTACIGVFAAVSDAQTTQTSAPPAPARVVTIYSSADPQSFDPQSLDPRQPIPGYAVVQEHRPLQLQVGNNTVRLQDFPSLIDPTTLAFKSLTAPLTTQVLEQSYAVNASGPDTLLRKSIGRRITVTRSATGAAARSEAFDATLLAFDSEHLVLAPESDPAHVEVISRSDIASVKFDADPASFVTRPTVVWEITAQQAGLHDAQISYQCGGITWRADYALTLSANGTADLVGWASIVNHCGTTFEDAKLKLLAGDVNQVPRTAVPGSIGGASLSRSAAFVPMALAPREEAFSNYHLYTLDRPVSLPDGIVKQVPLFAPASVITFNRTYFLDGTPDQETSDTPMSDPVPDSAPVHATSQIVLKNSKQASLGFPLPAGRFRIFENDSEGARQLVGSTVVHDTPTDEKMELTLGTAFDITGTRRETKLTRDRRSMRDTWSILVENRTAQPQRVVLSEHLFRYTEWKIIKQSDPCSKKDQHTVEFPIDVKPRGSKTVEYTVEYTW